MEKPIGIGNKDREVDPLVIDNVKHVSGPPLRNYTSQFHICEKIKESVVSIIEQHYPKFFDLQIVRNSKDSAHTVVEFWCDKELAPAMAKRWVGLIHNPSGKIKFFDPSTGNEVK